MKTATKKITYIVMKGNEEIIRVATARQAEMIAAEIGGYVVRYEKS